MVSQTDLFAPPREEKEDSVNHMVAETRENHQVVRVARELARTSSLHFTILQTEVSPCVEFI